ncbi:hypothetical protein WG915_08290 [Corynebacterium sp. H128]|uniref:hypothetical protein n=1 Tax=Corynebacterium sp. H128 TaxID=3133427 RepID=UPI0030A829F7
MKWLFLYLIAAIGVVMARGYQARSRGVPITEVLPFRFFVQEFRLWQDVVRLARRKQVIPFQAETVMHTKGMWTLPIALGCASLIELIAIELLLDSLLLRGFLAFLSVYGLALLVGYCGRQFVYPSFRDPKGITLKVFGEQVARIPLEDITTIRFLRTFATESHAIERGTLILGGPEGTNLEILLERPTMVSAPRKWWQRPREVSVTRIELWADEPQHLKYAQHSP